jgi:hypothetical protein
LIVEETQTGTSSLAGRDSMQGFVCWDDARVRQVMQTEALQDNEADFLATHRPMRLRIRGQRTPVPEPAAGGGHDEHAVLRAFLDSPDHAFATVTGDVGTGKSHLIRWLAMQLPETERRRVVLLPRINTNLRSALLQIVKGMTGDQVEQFRSRILTAGEASSQEAAAERLLSELAIACGAASHGGGDGGSKEWWKTSSLPSGVSRDQLRYLAEDAPTLLYDPIFRNFFLRPGGSIRRLVRHAFGQNERVETAESKEQFDDVDLPKEGDIDLNAAARSSRELWRDVGYDPSERAALVAWLNHNLPTAIRGVLNIGRDELTNVMTAVRRELAGQGRELVILIEDFVKQQGVERELLESLLVEPKQEGEDETLCTLRTALACTKGYFDAFRDTVRDRVSFRVFVDAPEGDAKPDAAIFAAGYLNASRLDGAKLERWASDNREAALAGADHALADLPPNACEGCRYREQCHNAFGHANGVGLYPFNSTAVRRLSDRAGGGGFNPRKLVVQVLSGILTGERQRIEQGAFPTEYWRDYANNSARLSQPARAKVTQGDPAHGKRRLALLEAWSDWDGHGGVPNLHPGIHDAFALPPLDGAEQTEPDQQISNFVVDPPLKPDAEADLPRELAKYLEELEAWQRGGSKLTPAFVNNFRQKASAAIEARVDWDTALVLNKGEHTQPMFQQRFINFADQVTTPGKGHLVLTIPTPGQTRERAAFGCEALLRQAHHGGWRFRDGARYQRAAAECLEAWADHLLSQVRATRLNVRGKYDPVPAAVELLALGHRLLGRPKFSAAGDDAAMIDAILGEPPPAAVSSLDGRSDSWKSLGREFLKQRPLLLDVVLSRVTCTKGQRKAQVVDASQLIGPLRQFRRAGKPKLDVPEDAVGDPLLKAVAQFRKRVDDDLAAAVTDERDRFLAAAAAVRAALGDTPDLAALTEAVNNLCDAGRDAGILGRPSIQKYEAARDDLKAKALDDSLIAASKVAELRVEDWPIALLDQLGRNSVNTLRDAAALIDAIEGVVGRVEDEADGGEIDNTPTGRAIENIIEALDRIGRDAEPQPTSPSVEALS